ncbi:hypothetical protein [Ferrimonas marina]|uniref:Uncharacterized protein n=1 Tax=Ferrimonas marina TaxID=299255 RepID=A0A1M5R2M1_9GAMM|nr:hypothetical protein [Ferrimonas marina]SHH20366.1 hypothetical protein SAMN02745129_1454 [Ferrimonas marina]
MKSQIGAAMLVLMVSQASAESQQDIDKHKVNEAMSQMIRGDVVITEDAFGLVELHPGYQVVDGLVYVSERMSEIYVTRKEAKALKLEKTDKFYLYADDDLEELIQALEQRVNAQQPEYFSVDLHRNFEQQTGAVHYVARVITYR